METLIPTSTIVLAIRTMGQRLMMETNRRVDVIICHPNRYEDVLAAMRRSGEAIFLGARIKADTRLPSSMLIMESGERIIEQWLV